MMAKQIFRVRHRVHLIVASFIIAAASILFTTEADAEDVLIGVSIPLSGPSGATGEWMQRAMEMAIEEINADGGVNGNELRLSVNDDEGNPSTAVALIDKLKAENAVAIIGTYNSPVALGMAQRLEEAQIPLITVAISSAIDDLKNPYIYQINAIDRHQFRRVAQEFKKQGITKVAFMTDTTALGNTAIPVVEPVFAEEGVEITAIERFDLNAVDMSPQVFRARDSGAEGVFIHTVGAPFGRVLVGLRQTGWNVPAYGVGSASDPAVLQAGGEAVNGLRFTDFVDNEKPQYKEFVEKYNQKYNTDSINNFAALSYDMVYIISDSLAKAASYDPQALRDAMDGYSSEERVAGAAGTSIAFSAEDHLGIEFNGLVIKEYVDGEIVQSGN
jgi:branched-chain amino acid transport system substrate-binding protein